MDGQQKKQFTELVYKHYQKDVVKFLQSNKDYIKSSLSRSQGKIFEDEVLKRNHLEGKFLGQILEKIDEEHYENFITRIIKTIFKIEKELANSFVIKKEFDEEEVAEYLAPLDEKEQKTILNFFELIGIDLGISVEQIQDKEKTMRVDLLQELLKERLDDIVQLKQKIDDTDSNHKKEIKELKAETAKVIKSKDDEIATLKAELTKLENKEPTIKYVEVEKTHEDKNKVEESILEKSDLEKSDLSAVDKIQIDFETALLDLEDRVLMGVVKAEGIHPDKGFVVVSPIVPILSENSNINREEFISRVDYRSDYSSFMLFLSPDVLKIALSEEDAEEYPYLTNDQKFSYLFEAFCKKIVFFTPKFVKKEDDKYKLNAYLMDRPVAYEDFNNSTFVPAHYLSKKEFETAVTKHRDLVLDNYPYSLSSNLKYIFVKDTIYEINYIPKGKTSDGRYIVWKYNEQSTKEPFRRLDIKINSSESDKYILTPSVWKDIPNDLYVKNIMFIQVSAKTNTVFDEDEFINNVSENAKSKNLYYKENDLKNFHVAVKSSNLVILAGPSGIGKTRLPMIYANTLGLDIARKTVLFVPISPSYLEPEDVLGYIRPISDEGSAFNAEYMESQTGLVSFLNDAAEHKDKIHLVIFDEMNLSQIEHWFAPFISLLEQDPDSRALNLYSDNLNVKNAERYPSSINIGENVFFVGTVNIDETTKQISDRLLDRAIVINLAAPSFTSLKDMGTASSENYPEISYSRFATVLNKVDNSATEFSEKEFALINDINSLLTDSIYNKSISFRSLNKMALYLKNSKGILSRNEALDFVISQIVVKKINGSKEELDEILSDDDTRGILKVLDNHSDVSEFVNTKKLVQQKILEINKYGFTR